MKLEQLEKRQGLSDVELSDIFTVVASAGDVAWAKFKATTLYRLSGFICFYYDHLEDVG